jgi:predicted DNA-binding antitoxin AbrB/MazE fold protein
MTTSDTQSVAAIYENGILRLLEPLALPEHARVRVTVAAEDEALSPDREQIRAALAAAGLILVEPSARARQPLSPQARAELGRQVPPGRPLSEIIIEERGER